MKGVDSKHVCNFCETNKNVLTNIYNPIPELDIFTFALVPLLRSLTSEKLARVPEFIPQKLVEFLRELVEHPLFEPLNTYPLDIQPGYLAAMARAFIEPSPEATFAKYNDSLITSPLIHLREKFMKFGSEITLTLSEWLSILLRISQEAYLYKNQKDMEVYLPITVSIVAILKTQGNSLPWYKDESVNTIVMYKCAFWEGNNFLINYLEMLYKNDMSRATHFRNMVEYTGVHYCLNYLYMIKFINLIMPLDIREHFTDLTYLHYSTFTQSDKSLLYYQKFTECKSLTKVIQIPYQYPDKPWKFLSIIPLTALNGEKYILFKLKIGEVISRLIYNLTQARFVASNILVYSVPNKGIPLDVLHHDTLMIDILEKYYDLVNKK